MNQKRYLAWFLAFGLTCASGCAKAAPTTPVSVHGMVTLDGAPVTGGQLIVHHTVTKVRYSIPIEPDGHFTGTELPRGVWTVTVDTGQLYRKSADRHLIDPKHYFDKEAEADVPQQRTGPPLSEAEQAKLGTYMRIPRRYRDPKTSPLKLDLTKDDQEEDLQLTKE